jgi:amino acid adenylation domain-containing protein
MIVEQVIDSLPRASSRLDLYKGSVLELIDRVINKTPHHPALEMGAKSFTYKEIDKLSDQLAHALRRKGVGPDTLVALLLPRSCEMILSILAILKAGGAYIPISLNSGIERIDYILKSSGCNILVTQDKVLQEKGDFGRLTIEVNTDQADWFTFLNDHGDDSEAAYPIEVLPDSLAYVIFTSGTTGMPKGVMIEHGSLYSLIKNYIPKLGPTDRVLQSMSYSCDSSIVEIFPALCYGGTLILWEENISETIRKEGITHTCLTPSMTEILDQKDLVSLKTLVLAGERLNTKAFLRIPSTVKIFNGYGPTECTVALGSTFIRSENEIHIGSIFRHCKAYVVKNDLTLCDVGEEGELLIGGSGVARGYLNQASLTKDRFLANPFDEGRVYRTGDKVRWNVKGQLEYLGRMDRQVKIQGFRVELDGIEQIMAKFPEVQNCFVTCREGKLAGYFTPKEIEIKQLKDYLNKCLPAYMVPSYLIGLDHFPINNAGKVDMKRLPDPLINLGKRGQRPKTKRQQELASLWSEILFDGQKNISVDDNFFDLGGNSLDALKLTKVLKERYPGEYPLYLIYKNPRLLDYVKGVFENPLTNQLGTGKEVKSSMLLDGIKSIPSTLHFYLAYSTPLIIFCLLLFYFPLIMVSFVLLEFLFFRSHHFPYIKWPRRLKLFLQYKGKYSSQKFIEYYPLKKLPRCAFSIHPHGVTEDHIHAFESYLQKKNIVYKVLNHESLFHFPFSRTWYSCLSGMPAKKQSYELAAKRNWNLLVTPGDIAEGYRADQEGAVALSTQKHFFKYCLQTGTSIVPVYVHNNHHAFSLFNHFFKKRLSWAMTNRMLVFQPFWGRWYLPIPFKIDLLIASGGPLVVEKRPNPSWEDVESLHRRYQSSLRELYKKNSPKGSDLTFF